MPPAGIAESAERLVAPAGEVRSLGRGFLDAIEDRIDVHRVVTQALDVIRIVLVAVPAVLRTLSVVDLKRERLCEETGFFG